MTTLFPAGDSIGTECINCGAEIPQVAKFCAECGAPQAAPVTGSRGPVEEMVQDATVSGTESQSSSSIAANQASYPVKSENADERASKLQNLVRICGIAAALIVLVGIGVWYLRATVRQKAIDNYNLGLAYEKGQGVPQDETQAVIWFRKAAEQGNADAQYSLGLAYVNGDGGLVRDELQAIPWIQKAARQGNAGAECLLGLAYSNAVGVPKDEALAVSWLRKAAEQGNGDAQAFLGLQYRYGGGVEPDAAQAISWYRKAAEQGNKHGESLLGLAYEDGEGGLTQDYAQALFWIQKAANQGEVNAKNDLPKVKQEQERMVGLMGTPIDFAALYAKLYGTGMEIGKRYQVKAIAYSDLNALGSNSGESIHGDHDFDDSTQLEATINQAVNTPNNADLVCSFVVSMGTYHRLLIHRAENCQTVSKY